MFSTEKILNSSEPQDGFVKLTNLPEGYSPEEAIEALDELSVYERVNLRASDKYVPMKNLPEEYSLTECLMELDEHLCGKK